VEMAHFKKYSSFSEKSHNSSFGYLCPHVEFLIMEAVLEHPEKTLSEIVHDLYTQTGSEFTSASIFFYLKRNHFSRKKVCLNLSTFYTSVPHIMTRKMNNFSLSFFFY